MAHAPVPYSPAQVFEQAEREVGDAYGSVVDPNHQVVLQHRQLQCQGSSVWQIQHTKIP